MDYISIIIVAIALAMDAFSVSISCGICIPDPRPEHYFRIAFHFGLFQFMMPIIGYFAGSQLENSIKEYDHWIAFGLLLFIGLKMIRESFQEEEIDPHCEPKDPSRGMSLIILSIATSIDALAVGLSLGVLNRPIIVPSIIIGIVCSIFSIVGVALGNKVSNFAGKRAESIGGILLVAIGLKILFEHIS